MTASLVQLRDVHVDDLDPFFEHQKDAEAVAMAAFPPRDREAFLTHCGFVQVETVPPGLDDDVTELLFRIE